MKKLDNIIVRDDFVSEISFIISECQEAAIRSVDFERVKMYWNIGRKIFEEEQAGKEKADYRSYLIKYLSNELQPVFGSGFSKRQLELFRQFFRTFPIANTLYSQLGWSQYKLLIRVDNQEKRDFCVAETAKNNWSVSKHSLRLRM